MMEAKIEIASTSLYENDFVHWIDATVEHLRNRDYAAVDWENLIDEIEDMSRRERKALKSNLIVILLHLLKWKFQPEYRTGSWRGSIREHRRRITEDLKDSPSLVPYLQERWAECYESAREQSADETDLPLATFPTECPYTSDQVLDSKFLP
jgi:hypothetical protein